ncbi:MAG: hypothetical protein A9Z00_09300 [Thermobacillus sp. ZCTH02-B1]|uniref:hypothetical protein n=1 Tax=Thermobacillus sp. ZCTH02-B1 TaxID=1858795 RepID=UPI000B559EE3|nr:hypothetical protein [Thermobacillus sp. ZCTH02-B1]OUM94878.1 MAG: hypothetical protein A9Z00_09300 [Thermobacillus sp. ZCTH02-B1]
MNSADNISKHHLRNVYVIAGHACGGKTTASRTRSAGSGSISASASEAKRNNGPPRAGND